MAEKTNQSGENPMINEIEMQKLINKGEKNGVLSFAEINDAISDDIKSYDGIDDLVVQFRERGIELVDKEKETVKKTMTKPKKPLIRKSMGQKNNMDDMGTHSDDGGKGGKKDPFSPKREGSDLEFGAVTDPVKMYLKEMGMVTLLSREGEIQIAKKIENGERDILRSMLDCPLSLATIFMYGERMEAKSKFK